MNILIVDDELAGRKVVEEAVRKVIADARIDMAQTADEAASLCMEKSFDVAFMDICMPGEDGLSLAKRIRDIQSRVNIILVSAYSEYAMDAHRLYVSGYIMKPPTEEDIREALSHLRYPVHNEDSGLYVRCFGSFEVFYNGQIVSFTRSKSKELFAYLIDRQGAAATNAECCAVLWGDEADGSDRQRNHFHHIWSDLRNTLRQIGCGDTLRQSRNSYAVNPDRINCDYYQILRHNPTIGGHFSGEYMTQYAWAENRIGIIERLDRMDPKGF